MPSLLLTTVLLFFIHFLQHQTTAAVTTNLDEATSLLTFKSSTDPHNTTLTSWTPNTDPCANNQWLGVTCLRGRVTRVVLENLNLTGPLPPNSLSSLTGLRVLSLKNNNLNGQIPEDLGNLNALKLLFLAHNGFTGTFPSSVLALSKLYRLDLSYNSLTGDIPLGLNVLSHLLTLRLEENGFTGQISGLDLPDLQDFNVSGNRLTGRVPTSLSGFPGSAFLGNPGLCGAPLSGQCGSVSEIPTRPGAGGATAAPAGSTVASSETKPPLIKSGAGNNNSRSKKISTLAIVAIIVGDVLVLALVSVLLYCYFCKNYDLDKKNILSGAHVEKLVYSSSPYRTNSTGGGSDKGKMVFLDDGERRFELEDLLRASAEMLGKGGFGTAYKAVLDDGNVVAVKRLKELNVNNNAGGKREFEERMELLGRLKHPNLVALKAYYFARDEKLLVCEYMPNGNLFWLLHGNRGPGRTPLDWTTRLRIASGTARGLAFLHSSSKALKLIHGNIKSTNILIDKSGNATLSDYGLSVFASPSTISKSNGYRAPEAALDPKKLTQKSDVYSFGVLILELLTGKCPSVIDQNTSGSGYSGVVDLPRWVQSVVREEWTAEVFDLELMRYRDIEEEMVGLLQIGMACTQSVPDQRPKMNHVVKMIDDLRGVEVTSPLHENLGSVSDSPSVSEDTGRATSE